MTKLNKHPTRNPHKHAEDKQLSTHQDPSKSVPSNLAEVATHGTARGTYLGSTSFLSVFHEKQPSLPPNPVPPLPVVRGRWSCDHALVESRLVQLLSALGLCEELLISHYEQCHFTVIPLQLMLQPLRMAQAYLKTGSLAKDMQKGKLYSKITQNTARPFSGLHISLCLGDFYTLFTGANLRWEFIGIIFSCAGLGALSGKASQRKLFKIKDQEQMTADAIAEEMTAASNACIEICKQHENVNDLMIWLYISHFTLASDVYGETSHRTYSLFGDLVSYVHALGLHRSSHSDVPFFISETRKRLFVACFRADKNLATLFGRPPRLPYRYCDISLPLDVDDNSILQHDSPDQLLHQLRPGGWNVLGASNGRFRQATFLRVRFMISVLREQTLELSLGQKSSKFTEELRTTYQQCIQLWDQIPKQYHYRADCWEFLSPSTCVAIVLAYFEYLHTVFQVERIRCRENQDDTKGLLDTSMKVISVANDLMKHREQAGSVLRSPFLWIFLFNGLPIAGALATEVHRCTIAEIPISCSASRSEIIRKLSVFVSWLGSADPSISHTHRMCVELNKGITKLLDDTLNYLPSSCSNRSEEQMLDLDHGGGSTEERSCDAVFPWENTQQDILDLPDLSTFGSSTEFLSWFDDLGFETSLPELLL